MKLSRPVATQALALVLSVSLGCTATLAPHPGTGGQPSGARARDATGKPPTSDETADAFLAALKARDFDAASSQFDSTMKTLLPNEKLAAVWTGAVAKIGNLVSWKIVQRAQEDGDDIRVAHLQFERGELESLLSIHPKTQQLGGFFLNPVAKAAVAVPPAPYVDEAAFHAVEVSVGAEPFLLGGTLTLPTAGEGPFPAAVLVHGSGPNDRDETVGANKTFKDLAEGLACRGIAVLRYDKRTFQYGHKLGNNVSIDDEVVLDAVAGIEVLKSREDINPRRIFVIGHSLGALLAPEIATRSATAAGAVLLAPPGRAPWDSVLSQMRYLGTPPDKLAAIQEQVNLVKAGKLGEGTLLGAPQAYWQDWASRDGVKMARKLGKPLLILRGERDYQVTEDDLMTWKKGLNGMPQVEIVTIPTDNHLFLSGSGKPGPAEYETPGHVDAQVIDRLVAFILQPVKRKR